MTPYYDDGSCVIFHGDCRELLPRLVGDLICTDPPYGIGYVPAGGSGRLYKRNAMPPVFCDNEPFDPSWLLALTKRLTLFGANHYASRLPDSATWFVWDKRAGSGSNTFADCELVWSNSGGPARLFTHYWNGGITASERSAKLHPTQKPVVLMRWLLQRVSAEGETVLDPYMGSGPILRAAKYLGRKAIGIEIEERYCEIAAKRLAQEVFDFGAVGDTQP